VDTGSVDTGSVGSRLVLEGSVTTVPTALDRVASKPGEVVAQATISRLPPARIATGLHRNRRRGTPLFSTQQN
jgi:hypothetical protein